MHRSVFNKNTRGGGCTWNPFILIESSSVSTHSRAEAAASFVTSKIINDISFQHTAARRRLLGTLRYQSSVIDVSTHSRAEAAALDFFLLLTDCNVSTHSRAEAAALVFIDILPTLCRFNTQPRGGGCKKNLINKC